MSEVFEIKMNRDFINVYLFGFKNFNDVKTLVNEISNASRQYNSFKILIQNYSTQHLSPFQCVFIVEYLENAGITRRHMIAMVNPLKNYIDNEDEFFVTVAMNRGWYNVKIFDELEKAKLWLNS